MAMNLTTMKAAAVTAAKDELVLNLITNQTDDADKAMEGIAKAIGEAVEVALQHVIDNAVTVPTGDTIT